MNRLITTAVCLLASGCASITGSEMQSVIVSTRTRAGLIDHTKGTGYSYP